MESCFSNAIQPVIRGGANRDTRQKGPHNPKSLASFLHALAGVCMQTVLRDGEQSVAMPITRLGSWGRTWVLGKWVLTFPKVP